MKSLLQLIHDYHSGVKNAGEEILKRMEPLIKSYASRIHCMERDDATQELYLTLLNTLPYLNGKNFSEGECVRYMQTAIENRYRALCRYHLSEPEREDFDTCSLTLQADNLVGKASFTEEQLADNFQTLIDAINKAKPAAVKGQYLKSVTLTSTMGPGVKINPMKLA